MLKKVLFFCFCIFFTSTANAEIKEFTNSFDNMKCIYSLSEKTKVQFPKFFIFRKLIRPENTTYYISIKNNNDVSKMLSNFEDIKIKIDDGSLYSCPTTISTLSDLTTQATILLDDKIINSFANTQKITFQIPVLMERSSIIESYYHIELPQPVLAEWKQVIAME